MKCRNGQGVPNRLSAHTSELYSSPECQINKFEWPQISEEEKAMLGYDETQEDPIFEDEDFIEVDSDEDFEF